MEFVERLVSLIPRPKVNLVRYHGVFAPAARLRQAVTALARKHSGVEGRADRKDKEGHPCCQQSGRRNGRYLDWQKLLARVFKIDITICPLCGQKGMQAIAVITKSDAMQRFLEWAGEPTAPPQLAPARYPEQLALGEW